MQIYIQACWPQINTNNYLNGSVDFFHVHFVIIIVLVIQVLLRSNCTFYLSSFCISVLLLLLKVECSTVCGQPNAKYVHFCTCTRYLMCT